MSEPIYKAVEADFEHYASQLGHEAAQARAWIHHAIRPHRYHQDTTGNKTGNTGNITQEPKVSLLDTAIAKGEDLLSHLKTLAEDAVPALEAVQSSAIAQVAEKYLLGDAAEQFIADMVDTLASKYGTLKTDASAAPAVDPSAQAATADPAAAPAA